MKFVPRAPREGINVSDEHPLKEAAVLIVGLSAIFATLALLLVFLVEIAILAVSPETEVEFFAGWTPSDIVPVDADDARTLMVTSLMRRLEQHWPDSDYVFRIAVSDDEVPNALAVPGGLIVVTTGLLDGVESENELAFVLGHELGHFRNRDHLRGVGRGIAFSLLFAAVASREGGSDLGLAIADLTLRGFSRDQENDADQFGLYLMQAEYGHVAESWRFFERARELEGGPGRLQSYLSTHPDSGDRIERILDYAASNDWPTAGPMTAMPAASAE